MSSPASTNSEGSSESLPHHLTVRLPLADVRDRSRLHYYKPLQASSALSRRHLAGADASPGPLLPSFLVFQHFPMNLCGKQIGHILGDIPGALYAQAVLQGMSRAYQCVLEEANQRIVEFRLRATMPASSAMTPLTPPSAAPPADLLAAAQSKAVPLASGDGGGGGLSIPVGRGIGGVVGTAAYSSGGGGGIGRFTPN